MQRAMVLPLRRRRESIDTLQVLEASTMGIYLGLYANPIKATKPQKTVIILGGIYGGGKSTKADEILKAYGEGAVYMGYDSTYAETDEQKALYEKNEIYRDNLPYKEYCWKKYAHDIKEALQTNDLVVVDAGFRQSRYRREIIQELQREDTINVIGLFLLANVGMAIRRVLNDPSRENHVVPKKEHKKKGIAFLWELAKQNKTDIILPSRVKETPMTHIPRIYRNVWKKINKISAFALQNPNVDEKFAESGARWLAINPDKFHVRSFIQAIKAGEKNILRIRDVIETGMYFQANETYAKAPFGLQYQRGQRGKEHGI